MKAIVISILCLLAANASAISKATITVQAGKADRVDCVVSADVGVLELQSKSFVTLYEKVGKEKKGVPCQLVWETGKAPRIYWILDGTTPAGVTRTFVAQRVKKEPASAGHAMTVEDTQRALILKKDGKDVLQYNYAPVNAPAGVDPAYGRGGFIHPAYSPAGKVLTTIQPKDHYHHYGIWNPWTRMEYGGKVYDLWNLGDKQGTVRPRGFEDKTGGDVFAGCIVGLEHVIFTPAGDKMIMDELWNVKAWNTGGGYLWDFESDLRPCTELPIILKEYRYGGFGFRATEEWTRENSEMMTSEGKTRQQIDGSTARWIYVTGNTKGGRSGMLFMSHPRNYNSPEPLRIWDENANGGRGDVFINFAPTKNKDWKLEPGEQYILRYRVLSYDGEMTREKADRLWNDFAHPPVVIVNPFM